MTHAGFYSVVQFLPDPFRAEGANVGIIVGSDELGELDVHLARDNASVKHLLPESPLDDARLTSAKRALERKLRRIEPSEAALRAFMGREISNVVITPPMPLAFERLDAEARDLFARLVEPPRRAPRRRPRAAIVVVCSAAVLVMGIMLASRGDARPGDIPMAATNAPDAWAPGTYAPFQSLDALRQQLKKASTQSEREALTAKISAKEAEIVRAVPASPARPEGYPPAPPFARGKGELRVSVVKSGAGAKWLSVFRATLRDRGGKDWLPWTMTIPGNDGPRPVDMIIINDVAPEAAAPFCAWVRSVGWNEDPEPKYPCQLRPAR